MTRIKNCRITLIAIFAGLLSAACTGNIARTADDGERPVISGLHTLSVHVRDTVTHDSLFNFLADELQLPVYYHPVSHGVRKYSGLYTGNIVLEPCGPFPGFRYGSDDFTAIFFGFTFDPFISLNESEAVISNRQIEYRRIGNEFLYLTDSMLSKNNIYVSVMEKPDFEKDREIRDSLGRLIKSDSFAQIGIEYIKTIYIGYPDEKNLNKWRCLIKPDELENNIWKRDLPEIIFVKSNIEEVRAIEFKVRSLDAARQYLVEKSIAGCVSGRRLKIDKESAFGLTMYFTEEE
jgi:hypothetical protein